MLNAKESSQRSHALRGSAHVERKGVMHYSLPYSQQETKVIK